MISSALQTVSVVVEGRSHKQNLFTIQVLERSREDRIRSTVKVAAAGAAITLAMVCLPVIHFVLVPAGLIVTPILAIRKYKSHLSVEPAAVPCPECGKSASLPRKATATWPIEMVCEHCGNFLHISQAVNAQSIDSPLSKV